MPRKTKTYPVVTQAGGASIQPVPQNPSRIALFVQNTSVNPGLMRLGDPTQGQGSDILFAAGAFILWDQPDSCPLEALNFSSVLLATWCVMETIPGPLG